MRKVSLNIDDNCPLYPLVEEIIYHLFKNCDLEKSVFGRVVDINCHPKKFELSIVDWLEHIWKYKFCYNKMFDNPLEKIITIT